jgi:hypothetical protein
MTSCYHIHNLLLTMQKDSFQSSGRAPAAPTQSLGPTGTGALARGTVGVPDPELRAKAAALTEKLEPRIELLIRSCQAAALPMPGVHVPAFRHKLPPNADQIMGYLAEALRADAKLAQAVQVAIYRFQQVVLATASGDQRTDLEQLRRQVFYLTNLSAEFKDDRILAMLFPAPQAREGVLKAVQPSAEDRRRTQAMREEAVRRAVALGQGLAPRMAIAALALEALDKGLTHNVTAIFSPQGRQAKMIAVALTGDEATATALRDAHAKFEALKALVPRVRAGEADLEELRPLAVPLGQLGATFEAHPLLKDLFTRPMAAPGAPPAAAAGGR